jgi:hypothetical protein
MIDSRPQRTTRLASSPNSIATILQAPRPSDHRSGSADP